MPLILAAAIGGALGSAARYLVNVACATWLGPAFPWATLFVNVVGSFLMGAVVAAAQPLLGGSTVLRTFLATGILGGFTTFSAFSLDVYELMDRRQPALAVIYVAASLALSFTALLAGLWVVRTSLR